MAQPVIPSRVLANVEAAITTLRGIAAQVQSARTALDGRLGGVPDLSPSPAAVDWLSDSEHPTAQV